MLKNIRTSSRIIPILTTVLLISCFGDYSTIITKTGQSEAVFNKSVTKEYKMNYLLHLPEDYTRNSDDYPLILFLHGYGERGDNVELVKKHGPPKIVENDKNFPFIVLSPQCPDDEIWMIGKLEVLLADIVKNFRVDKSRLYLTGLSMGGYGAWDFALKRPNKFAAVAPICGGGQPVFASLMKDVPFWVFHGEKDSVVPVSESTDMVEALKQAGADVKLTLYPEADHDSWTETYDNPELYEWFLSHNKK